MSRRELRTDERERWEQALTPELTGQEMEAGIPALKELLDLRNRMVVLYKILCKKQEKQIVRLDAELRRLGHLSNDVDASKDRECAQVRAEIAELEKLATKTIEAGD